jgi:proline dehydrogenase
MLEQAIAHTVERLPRSVVARVAKRYIAGEDLPAALNVIERLSAERCLGTIDILGERSESVEQTIEMRRAYQEALRQLAGRELPSGVSVKLTSLGLHLDPDLCRDHLQQILETADEAGRFVRVDMEESAYTQDTLDMVIEQRRNGRRVGAVIQARLRRSSRDLARLAAEKIPVRLVKGIYLEPSNIAFTDFREVQEAYLRLMVQAVEAGVPLAVASHDDLLVRRAADLARASGLSGPQFEFQVLLGVRPQLRRDLVAAGHRVRVYVPFGREWFLYSTRRLRENPRIAWLIARALFQRGDTGLSGLPS